MIRDHRRRGDRGEVAAGRIGDEVGKIEDLQCRVARLAWEIEELVVTLRRRGAAAAGTARLVADRSSR
jgi:hypothetical protein